MVCEWLSLHIFPSMKNKILEICSFQFVHFSLISLVKYFQLSCLWMQLVDYLARNKL
jgi:hypothetical protein